MRIANANCQFVFNSVIMHAMQVDAIIMRLTCFNNASDAVLHEHQMRFVYALTMRIKNEYNNAIMHKNNAVLHVH